MADSTAELSRFRVDGMDCAACVSKVETATRRIPGVEDATVSLTSGTMVVRHSPSADLREVGRRVEALGYQVRPAAGVPTATRFEAIVGSAHADTGQDAHHGRAQDEDAHEPEHPSDRATEQHGHDHGHAEEVGPWWSTRRFRLTAGAGLALVVAYGVGLAFPDLGHWPFVVAMLVGLVPVARRALAAARYGSPFSIEMLMTIAAVGAVFIGAAAEASMVVFLFLVGEMLEGIAAGRSRASIRALANLVPRTAFIEVDGNTIEVPALDVSIGATVVVRPGDRVPADGVILEGQSAINEAPVSGESVPVEKRPGDTVLAGTVNGGGMLRVRSTAEAKDNTIARIVRLVEEAQESKAPTPRFVDSFSRYYTPGVLVAGALVALVPPLLFDGVWSEWIYKGLAVLLIGCPCAFVISTPAAIAAGLSAGARRGLLLKGGAVLEGLGRLTVIAFDKTGTLTTGKPSVTDLMGVSRDQDEVLRLAASIEVGSSHPLARAVLERAAAGGIAPSRASSAAAVAGKGVEGTVGSVRVFLGSADGAAELAPLDQELKERIVALNDQGKTVSVLVADRVVAGIIAVRDEPRPDARDALAELDDLDIETVMLTGDNQRTAAAIGAILGIDPRGGLLPADKMRIVNEMQVRGARVGKVGDGINDAPALAAAHVGIAMGGGTDVALETADAAALHGRMRDIPDMVNLSRATMRNIYQNLTIAFGLKAVFLVTTLVGITGLWPAILADTGATVLVTANAMRLLAWRPARS